MNSNMLAHAAVRQNLETLQRRGVLFVEPGEGYLACGWVGKGRLAEPDDIVEAAVRVLAGRTPPATAASSGSVPGSSSQPTPGHTSEQTLRGRKVLITAGPTYEDIDPVRYVGNRSSGRMGFALAAEAASRGAQVTLVSGPTTIAPPPVAALVRVRSAAEMHEAVMRAAAGMDLVIMAAAVADYAPARRAAGKIAKQDAPLTLTLERTRDILADVGAMRAASGSATPVLIGFAAETDDLVRKARDKRTRKRVDAIVANDVSRSDRGFEVETNAVTIVTAESEQAVELQSKDAVAAVILDSAEQLLRRAAAAPTTR
jgi:phosphopantothenoylcysteine decarboxylase/phosphopantothenate--cysteine ligase